ncbi:MAG: hypothetical protein KatS3mg032_0057 [Cyclobacteriaceae bacterium]|nr:MAG: hypothetical protein KatS3mg032_0057 [Cyclobacteriaceae bacterium]
MILPKLLIITCFWIQSMGLGPRPEEPVPCKKIKFSFEVEHARAASGRIVFRFEENRQDFLIYLLADGNKQLLTKNKPEISGLAPGRYVFVITGPDEKADFCPEFLEIEVK